jgi:hypothetical protein
VTREAQHSQQQNGVHLVSCGRCCRRQLLLLVALVDGRSWVKRRTCPAGGRHLLPIAPELGIERASGPVHCMCSAWPAACSLRFPSLLLRRSPQRSAAETCAALRNTNNPLDHLHPNARTALCNDIEAASRPRPPANAWLGTCVTGLQLPASPRPTSRPHSCSEVASRGAAPVASQGT